MLKRTFQLSTETTTYPVVRNWDDLDDEQIEACYAQGYDEDYSLFWFIDGVAFSLEADLHPLQGVFECFSDYSHYTTYWGTTYLAKFNKVGRYYVSITFAEVKEIQE